LSWHLPEGYTSRLRPEYHHDQPSDDHEIVHQPEAYDVVRYLLSATGRGTVIDVGCGSGRKLRELGASRAVGVDYGPNIEFCRTNHPNAGEWIETNLSHPSARTIANEASPDAIVICSDVLEHMPDPTHLLGLLEDCYRRGAIVITTTPDRARVRGTEHLGPPPNEAHVREWELDEYSSVIADAGLDLTFAGYTTNNTQARELKTILTLSDPDVSSRAVRRNASRPLAIIAAYNEEDIIAEVVADLLMQGCDVHLIDNWSTDGTWEIARRLAAAHPARVAIERFPDAPTSTYEWVPLLNRKADIAARYPGRWIIHTDADEIRRSPFPDINLPDAFDIVEQTGANRVDFRVINFQPTPSPRPGSQTVESSLRWFSFGTRAGHLRQCKAWVQGSQRVDLASTGGHEAGFKGAVDFRYKFLLKHYPLRSEAHAVRKIEHERHARRSEYESNVLGFHSHYDDLAAGGFDFENARDVIEWDESGFWREYGLFIMTDLLKSRIDRGWLEPGR
jgi:SAM-dependent methyltransferase